MFTTSNSWNSKPVVFKRVKYYKGKVVKCPLCMAIWTPQVLHWGWRHQNPYSPTGPDVGATYAYSTQPNECPGCRTFGEIEEEGKTS